MKTEMITKEEERSIGADIAKVLMLKRKKSNGRYNTIWGDKTEIGLFRTVNSIINQIIPKEVI